MIPRVIGYAAANPWRVLLALGIVTAVAVAQLPSLRLHVSAEGMTVEDDPAKLLLEDTKRTFGGADSLAVFFHDPGLLSEPKLAAVRAALDRLAALPFVRRVESLFTVNNVKSSEGEILSRPYLDPLPASEEAAQAVLADALRNPLVAGNLLAADGRSMVAVVYLRPEADDPDFESAAVAAIDAALEPLAGKLAESFAIGAPYVRDAITRNIRADQSRVLPLALVVSVLTLAVALRRVNAAVVPLLTAGVSIVWTLGLMAALGIPITVLSSIVPALIIIVGASETNHLLTEYYAAIDEGRPSSDALVQMARGQGMAVLLTFATTYIGFLSIATSRIELVQQFGWMASSGLLLNFVVAMTLVPAYLALADRRAAGPARRRTHRGLLQRAAAWVVETVLRHKGLTVAVLGLVAAGSLWGASLVRVNSNPLDYFGAEAPIIQRLNSLQRDLAGVETLSIVARAGIQGTFLQVYYLEQLQRIQRYLASTGRFDTSASFADFSAFVNSVMEENTSGPLRLPDSDDVLREFMLFVDHEAVAPYVSSDYGTARIVVRHSIASSGELRAALADVERYLRDNVDPGLKVAITGASVLAQHATDTIGYGQAMSIALMLAVIAGIVMVLYASWRAGLIAVVPLLFPIALLFGAMGYFGIPLDTSTAMVASIALGICIDDTLHFMARYHQHSRAHGVEAVALIDTVRDEALPMLSTTTALALGFSVLTTSTFPPVVHFGLLSALVIVAAVVGTLTLLPILLSRVRLVTLYDLLTLQVEPAVLRKCQLLRGMRGREARKLVLLSELRTYADGESIVRKGETGQEMYVVLAGRAVALQRNADGSRTTLRTMAPGELFGEIALVCASPRTADVVAQGETQMLVLEWERIRRLSRMFPRITSKLFLNLAAVLGGRLGGVAPPAAWAPPSG